MEGQEYRVIGHSGKVFHLDSNSLPGSSSAFSESILESAGDILEVSHTASTSGAPAFSFLSPFV